MLRPHFSSPLLSPHPQPAPHRCTHPWPAQGGGRGGAQPRGPRGRAGCVLRGRQPGAHAREGVRWGERDGKCLRAWPGRTPLHAVLTEN